ncbi:MAG: hypothetical protein HYZ57_20370 [Acidobacteria bacterium]|nr:hypothetical protein [Acidobacteriota bacterium]
MDLTCPLDQRTPLPRAAPRTLTLARWVVPDLALWISLITLFYCLFLFDGTQNLFRDSDTGWHIRTGEAMLDGSGLPRSDPYSLLRSGRPWFAWEWGADVLMAAAHRLAGLAGVALLYAACIAACTWLWFRLTWVLHGNFLLAGALAVLMLSTANLHWLARPHIFGWIFLLGAIWYAERLPARVTAAHAAAIAAFSALWTNLHASFFLGPAIALIYAVAHLVRPVLWQLDPVAERARARRFGMVAALAAAGSLLNPYGLNLHVHVARYLGNAELLDRVGEFQSFNFRVDGAAQILVALGIAALGAVLAFSQRNLAHALLSAGLLALALRSARGLPLVALLLLPLANAAITRALETCAGLQPRLRRALDSFLTYSVNLRVLDGGFNGAALLPVLALLACALVRTPAVASRAGFPGDQFPVAAAEAVAQLPADARLLAPDKFGGYLIYRFEGRRKVYFDGRSDFYGSEYMKDYLRLIEVRPGWREQLDRGRFTHALLPNRYSLVPALEQLGWKTVYRDQVATLLESLAFAARRSPQSAGKAAESRKSASVASRVIFDNRSLTVTAQNERFGAARVSKRYAGRDTGSVVGQPAALMRVEPGSGLRLAQPPPARQVAALETQ